MLFSLVGCSCPKPRPLVGRIDRDYTKNCEIITEQPNKETINVLIIVPKTIKHLNVYRKTKEIVKQKPKH